MAEAQEQFLFRDLWHDLPPECSGEADNETGTWCGKYLANAMYDQQCLMKLSTLIKIIHCEVTFTALVEMTPWGANGHSVLMLWIVFGMLLLVNTQQLLPGQDLHNAC